MSAGTGKRLLSSRLRPEPLETMWYFVSTPYNTAVRKFLAKMRVPGLVPLFCLVCIMVFSGLPSGAIEPPAPAGTSVVGEEFWNRLSRLTSIYWTHVPLREGLIRVGASQNVAVVLDRRCDPEQPVTLTVEERPLRELFAIVAHHLGYEVAFLAPVVYVGPPEAAHQLEMVAEDRREDLRRLGKVGLAGLQTSAAVWPRLVTPRQLVVGWAQEAEWRVANPEEILHDLWPEGALPLMPIADRLTLVLLQFDRTFVVSETGELRIVPLSPPSGEFRRFIVGPNVRVLSRQLRPQFPDCRFTISGQDLLVRGPSHSLERLSQIVDSQKQVNAPREKGGPSQGAFPSSSADPFVGRRFTVREGRGTLQGVILQLARQLAMDVHFDAEVLRRAGIRLEEPIQFRVENGTIDDLWRAVLEPQGLKFQREGRTIRIFPAAPPYGRTNLQ